MGDQRSYGVGDALVVEAEVLRADEVDEAALGGGLDVRVGPSHAARQLRDGVLDVGARVGGEHEAADEALAALEVFSFTSLTSLRSVGKLRYSLPDTVFAVARFS